jgi:ComF family protein
MLLRLARPVVDFVLPPRCPGCGAVVGGDGLFCAPCWRGLRFLGPPWCAGCGAPFDYDRGADALCGACLAHPPRFDAARAALAYDVVPRQVLMRFKHGGRPHHAAMMARQMARVAADWLREPDVLLVPVPLARWRIWRRGYNQAALLAARLAREASVPMMSDALLRVRETQASGHAGAAARRRNVAGAFRVADRARPALAGRPVLLIDDVLTTGATADACAAVLARAGVGSVRLLCWARVLRD